MGGIGVFARQAADMFAVSQMGREPDHQFNLHLSSAAVEEFVRNAFYASMIPDEGRYPSVCLMCYRKERETGLHFLFNPRREPSAAEIAKLAHATALDGHICCVSVDGKLFLSGLHVTVLNEMRELGYCSSSTANPLKIVIRGPGYIEVSTGGMALVYKAGVITEETPLLHCDVMSALVYEIREELSELTSGTLESIDDVFNDLAKTIVRLGHGGMLMFAKEPQSTHFSTFRRLDCLLLQQLLVQYWNHSAELLADVGDAANLLNDEARAASSFSLAVSSDTSMLEKCISSIAHLSGVDGSIVLDFACKVVAFNAITARPLPGQPANQFVDARRMPLDINAIVGHRGSRHQSALSYARHVPGAVVFVISQDGGVTAFHNLGNGQVMCEASLRVVD